MGCQLRGCGFESRPGRRVGFTISSPAAPRRLGLRGEVANASHPWLPYVLLFTDAFELVFFYCISPISISFSTQLLQRIMVFTMLRGSGSNPGQNRIWFEISAPPYAPWPT